MEKKLNKLMILVLIASSFISLKGDLIDQNLIDKVNLDLLNAAKLGNVDQIEGLVSAGANINTKNNYGRTPLLVSFSSGYKHLDVVKELIRLGADVNQADEQGYTPLISASSHGYLDIVEELIKSGARVDQKNKQKNTALIEASGSRPASAIMMILARSSDQNNLGVVKELLKAGASVDIQNCYGISPLIKSTMYGNIDIAKELINAGADLNLENRRGDDALTIAGNRGVFNVRDFLARIKDIEENIVHQIYPEVYPKDLSEEERIIFAKRLINQHKVNLYPLVFEILDSLSSEQLKSIFTEREIRNLIKAYKNQKNYNLGYANNIINLAKKYVADNLQNLISRLQEEQQRQAHKKDVFADMFVITQD